MARGSLKNVAKLLSNVNKDISVEQQFLHDLEKSIELNVNKESRKPSQTYKPSSMNCMRASYYQVVGVDPDVSDSTYGIIGIGESGTDRHIRIQQAIECMKENGIDCEYIDVESFIKQRNLTDIEVKEKSGMETKCYNKKLNMSFLTDGIVKYRGKYYIFEFKTEISSKWWSRTGVDVKHKHQATAYSVNFGLDKVLFVYENRDNCQKKAYLLDVTEDMKQELYGYILTCDSYVQEKRIPPKSIVDNKVCQYCSYRKRCDKDGSK